MSTQWAQSLSVGTLCGIKWFSSKLCVIINLLTLVMCSESQIRLRLRRARYRCFCPTHTDQYLLQKADTSTFSKLCVLKIIKDRPCDVGVWWRVTSQKGWWLLFVRPELEPPSCQQWDDLCSEFFFCSPRQFTCLITGRQKCSHTSTRILLVTYLYISSSPSSAASGWSGLPFNPLIGWQESRPGQ